MKQAHFGSDLDGFLQEDGLLAECEAGALKRVVTWQIEQEMKRRRISRAKLASRMKTTPAALDRLFAPEHSSVTLQLLEQAALALGRKLKVELAWAGAPAPTRSAPVRRSLGEGPFRKSLSENKITR